ncbi:MAG: AraC family transcriptional regulator [Chitinophagaceae bacterium]
MDFKIKTQEKEDVPYFLITAPNNSPMLIPDARGIEATGYFGYMRFYEIECPDFSIWYSNYHIAKQTRMYGAMEAPMLELHFLVNNTIRYNLEGLGPTTVLQGQFNLSYAPYINNVTWFEKDEMYTTFDVHFSQHYLEKIAVHFPFLGAFLENVDKGIAGMLGRHHGLLTPEMSGIIRKILRCQYAGEIKNLYLQAKILELLVLSLDQISNDKIKSAEIVLRPYDIEKIREAHDYLIRNMDTPCTLIELAHKVGINDFKLKKGFKQIYGTTVYDSLIDARIEKAKFLLLETDSPINDIALITGYKNISSFITAFRKKVGFSPGVFKKLRKGKK